MFPTSLATALVNAAGALEIAAAVCCAVCKAAAAAAGLPCTASECATTNACAAAAICASFALPAAVSSLFPNCPLGIAMLHLYQV